MMQAICDFLDRRRERLLIKQYDYSLAVLKIEDGDALLIKTPEFMSGEANARVRSIVEERLPGIKAIIMPNSFDVVVLRGGWNRAIEKETSAA